MNNNMVILIGELVGTCLMILLGNGVVANNNLKKTGMNGAGAIQITLAWGLAVLLPAFTFGTATGAHFNPALTIGLAIDGSIATSTIPYYVIGQFTGAFLGACMVYVLYKPHFDVTDDNAAIRGCFCTAPSIRNPFFNLLSEIVGTFVLVFAIKGIGQVTDIAPGVDKLLVFGVIVSIGMSLGGLTGYAINPARDFGPRLAYTLLPFKVKKDSDFGYAWVPIVGPIIGSIIAILLYGVLF